MIQNLMQMQDFLLSPISLADLESIIEKSVGKALQSSQNTPGDLEHYVSVKTASKMIGVTQATIHHYIEEGRLVRYKIGRTTRLLKSDVLSIALPA